MDLTDNYTKKVDKKCCLHADKVCPFCPAAYGYLLAACAIPVFCMAVVRNAIGYIIERVFIGCSLASFVVCQFWSSIMFSPNVVGMSNAIAGGWGNAGAHLYFSFIYCACFQPAQGLAGLQQLKLVCNACSCSIALALH